MKLSAVRVDALCYPLREALRTSRGVLRTREGIRVALECADAAGGAGTRGVGEALPLPEFGTESLQECLAAARALGAALAGSGLALDALLGAIEGAAPAAPAARAAFDLAAHDLASRLGGESVAGLLAAAARDAAALAGERAAPRTPAHWVRVNAVCGAGTPDAAVRAARRAVELGYGALKLKVGAGDPGDDVARIAAVRAAVGFDLALRIDANGAWPADRALAVLEKLEPWRIELCEQPVPARDLAGLARVHAASPIAVAADEALLHAEGRAACAEGALASFAILKPTALGGLRAAAALAGRARARGVRCIATTAFDGPCGTAAALQLAAAVGDPERAHGLDAAAWVDVEFPAGLRPRAGRLRAAAAPGLLPDA